MFVFFSGFIDTTRFRSQQLLFVLVSGMLLTSFSYITGRTVYWGAFTDQMLKTAYDPSAYNCTTGMKSFLSTVNFQMLNGSETENVLLRFSGLGFPTVTLPLGGLFVSAVAGFLMAWGAMRIFSKSDEKHHLRPRSLLDWSHLVLAFFVVVETLLLAFSLPYDMSATYDYLPWVLLTYPLWLWFGNYTSEKGTLARRPGDVIDFFSSSNTYQIPLHLRATINGNPISGGFEYPYDHESLQTRRIG